MTHTKPRVAHHRWTHGESTYPLAESGRDFGAKLKAQSLGLYRVVTDDAEIIGFLLRDDEAHQIRMGHCLGFVKDDWEIERRQRWRVDAVARHRIRAMRRLD
jgi:hypothetical protein